ncbi:ATP synthase F0 subunit 8 (mitochondrion) [Gekko japonicus]|uniref:ATP synthase complex subunit 8 n=1 Tax=Gekko japonicus TaxID=146911 RepID=A0A0U2H895_GEKJA|nr:ATP synthase F0 subunit 8 [Gekko japonicus]ALE66006.1 ATP synthase F0 subunit 8 [Gekko japonicus]AMW90860.1 ATP synthase F0 subunit 8 [Gekko japonicus]
MPQLNPAPWFTILMITWALAAVLLKLIAPMQNTATPTKQTLLYKPHTWMWTWL